jgi:hypothetical protein
MDRKQREQRIAQSLDLNNLLGEELTRRVQAGKEQTRLHEAQADAKIERWKREAGIQPHKHEKVREL